MSAASRHARQYGIDDGDEIDYDYKEANEPYDRDYDPRDDHPPELIYYNKLVEYSSNLSKSIWGKSVKFKAEAIQIELTST